MTRVSLDPGSSSARCGVKMKCPMGNFASSRLIKRSSGRWHLPGAVLNRDTDWALSEVGGTFRALQWTEFPV